MKRVVITGMGTINPLGNNVADYWANLLKGVSGAAPITRFDASRFKTRFACEVKNYEPTDFFERNELKKYDLFSQFALISSAQAIEQSGLLASGFDAERAGVIWGSGNGGITTLEEQIKEFATGDGTPRYSPFLVPRMIVNMAPGLLSIKYGFKGLNFATVSACTASNNAIMDAVNYIRWGVVDVMLAGGSEAPVTTSSIGGFNSMKALSVRNDAPQKASRPFDRDRDGFVLGEGGGAFVLESYEHAKNRGATILAEIAGVAMTSDAYHITATHPDGDGAYRAMNMALKDAGVTIKDIDYINAHATSTNVGDPSELNAITRLLYDTDVQLDISATKSMTGHLLGAAGIIESIACVNCIQYGMIPPTINLENPEETDERINIVAGMPETKPVNTCLNNTSGFGGHNAMIVFKKVV